MRSRWIIPTLIWAWAVYLWWGHWLMGPVSGFAFGMCLAKLIVGKLDK